MFWVLLAFGILVCLALDALIVLHNQPHVAADVETPHVSESALLLLPFLGSVFVAIPFGLVFACFRSTRRAGLLLLVPSLFFVWTSPTAVQWGTRVRIEAFRDLAERSMVVEAVYAYEKAEGLLPATLQELVPNYLDTLPTIGKAARPAFEFLTVKEASSWYRNPWVLRMYLPDGSTDPGHLMYFPLQNNPVEYPGDRFEDFGDWVYLRE